MKSKSLANFPKKNTKKKVFDPSDYGHTIQTDLGTSAYNGLLGLEFELEGRALPAAGPNAPLNGSQWIAKADGSLRNGGIEYVLNQPCLREDAEPLIDSLFRHIADRGGIIENTHRCSTHVHLNMRGMKLNNVASFVALWGMFENVLANWCGEGRAGNLFALRLCDSSFAVNLWCNAFRTGNFTFSRDYRYLALNPAALNQFGSLEVRTLQGVSSTQEVKPWIDALLRLYDKSKEIDDPSSLVNEYSAFGGRGLLDRVFEGLPILPELIEKTGVDGVDKEVLRGFRLIQPILFALPWSEVCSEIKKPYIPDPFAPVKKKVQPTRPRPLTL